MKNYQAIAYPNHVVHVKAEESVLDPRLVAKLSAAGLVTHVVPDRHNELAKEPHIRGWAETLKACLEQAQKRELNQQANTCSASAQVQERSARLTV